MAQKPIICNTDEAIHIPECDPCEQFGVRVDALEECCDEVEDTLSNLEGRVSQNESDIADLQTETAQNTNDISDLYSTKQDILTAGNNIEIIGNEISADVTEYVAGNNIEIDGNVISADSYTGTGVVSVSNTKEISVDLSDYYDKDHLYTKAEIDAMFQNGFEFISVDTLPSTGDTSKVYLLATGDPDVRDMYVWHENQWKKIGTTGVDLDGYVRTTGVKEVYDEHTVTVWLPNSTIRRLTILGIGWDNVNTITAGDGYGSDSPGADTGGSVTP